MTKHFSKLLLLAALVSMLGVAARAQENENPARIIVAQVTGEVYVFTAGETYRLALRTGSLLNAGQLIATGPRASVMLAFSNGATVTIGENSLVALDEFTQTPFSDMFKMAEAVREPSSSQTRLELVRGELIANVKKLNKEEGSTYEVKTPLGVAGIRGTTFQISYIPESRKISPSSTSGGPTADFAIVMLEGTVEMNVPNRPRPIVIPQGKQLVLEDVDMAAPLDDAALAKDGEPSDAPVTAQALLMQQVQVMLNVTANISIPGIPGAPARPPVTGGADASSYQAPANTEQPREAAADKSGDALSLSPVPAPQIPAPRLSPTDGTGA